MATEDQNIKITFDTNAQQVTKQTNALGNSLDNTENSAKGASKSFQDLDKTFEQVYGDLQPLTTRMGEAEDRLYELALAGQTATTEYKELLNVVANYRKTQIQTDQTVDAAATTLGQKLGGAAQIAATGVQGVTAGMALFGDQSEETEKALLKVQAAMAFADAISNISSLGGQFRVFQNIVKDTFAKIVAAKAAEKAATDAGTTSQLRQNLAVLANPYVIAAVALTALTVGVYAWVKSSDAAAEQEERTAKAVKLNKYETDKLATSISEANAYAKSSNDIEILRARAYGNTDEEIQKLIKSQKELAVATAGTQSKDAYQNLLSANRSYWNAVKSGNQDLIDSAKDNKKEAEELYKQSNDAYNEAIIEDVKFTLETRIATNSKIKEDQSKADSEAEKAREKAKSEADKRKEEEQKDREDDATALAEFQATIVKSELQSKIDADDLRLEQIKEFNDSVLEEEERSYEEQKRIDEARIELENFREGKLYEIKSKGIELIKSIFGRSKEIQKAALIAEGAVDIAKTVKTTSAGNQAALAQGIIQAGPIAGPIIAQPAIALNTVSGGISIAAQIAATAKGLQALGGGGSTSSSASAISGQSSSGAAATPSVQFNNTSENQVGQSLAKSQANQDPIRVYVAESDITKAQEKVKVLVDKNVF
jgi:hypothetical protein